MYATEKYLKLEVKELLSQIQAVAADLGGDIQYLNQRILEQQEQIALLQQELQSLKEHNSNV